MSISTPTVVLVHGAFAESASWNPVIALLRRESVEVVAIANPLRGVASDSAYLRDVVAGIGGPVVLAGHSYGGMLITGAAVGDDAVAALVYIAAFAPEPGESAIALSGRFPGSTLGEALVSYPLAGGGEEVRIAAAAYHRQFCADVPAERAALMAATQRPVTIAALNEGLAAAEPAWRRLPSWFVFGELDRNIPAAALRWMAERAGARDTREIPGGSHALTVSSPEPVAEAIIAAVRSAADVPAR